VCDDLERPMLLVFNDTRVAVLSANEPLCVENGVLRVGVEGIFGGVADETLVWRERHPGWSDPTSAGFSNSQSQMRGGKGAPVSLVVGDDFNLISFGHAAGDTSGVRPGGVSI